MGAYFSHITRSLEVSDSMLNSSMVSKLFGNFDFSWPLPHGFKMAATAPNIMSLRDSIPIPGREQEGKELPFQVFLFCQGGKSFPGPSQ